MKFTVSTKPLSDALSLGIIDANVTNFYKPSCIAMLTATESVLKINLESSCIVTELTLKGKGTYDAGEDSSAAVSCIVDSKLLKQLAFTIDATVVTLEFTDSGLTIHAGKSKLTLPKMVDADMTLKQPAVVSDPVKSIDVDKSDWKFIKDHQMYAVSMSYVHPVYTKVWISADGDVLAGDFDNSLFTHSTKSKFGTTCLVEETVVNLFNSLPDGAKLIDFGSDSRIISCKTDGFELVTEFTPLFETNPDLGSYNSDIFLTMMEHPDSKIKVNVSAINKFLNQADLLASSKESTVKFSVEHGSLILKDHNIDCTLDVEGNTSDAYAIELKTDKMKKVFAAYNSETVYIGPIQQEDEVVGILVWNDDLDTVLAGVE